MSKIVEFLKDVNSKEFSYKKGEHYVHIEVDDRFFVRQPNSPKDKNWWTEFSKDSEEIFRIIPDEELNTFEKLEEERLLQL